MALIPPLFVLQVPSTAVSPSSNASTPGIIACTQPAQKVYLLSFSSPLDNRLTPSFNETILLALDILEYRFPRGVVVTTSSIAKFYSNGLDYENAIKDPNFKGSLFPMWRRLVTYPMPTMALINGHAFSGGLMTAMAHNYRIMNRDKGFLCLNELEFGAGLRPAMASPFRVKLSIKEELYREIVRDLEEGAEWDEKEATRKLERSNRELDARERVDEWESLMGVQRAKL